MKEILLTQGRVALVDDADYESLSAFKWHYKACGRKDGYAARREIHTGKTIYMHREVAHAPSGLVVDHINFNTLDNRMSNLRIVTAEQNSSREFRRKVSIGHLFTKTRPVRQIKDGSLNKPRARRDRNGNNWRRYATIRPNDSEARLLGAQYHSHKADLRWYAVIKIDYKKRHLGYFSTQEEAANAFRLACVEHKGEAYYQAALTKHQRRYGHDTASW